MLKVPTVSFGQTTGLVASCLGTLTVMLSGNGLASTITLTMTELPSTVVVEAGEIEVTVGSEICKIQAFTVIAFMMVIHLPLALVHVFHIKLYTISSHSQGDSVDSFISFSTYSP